MEPTVNRTRLEAFVRQTANRFGLDITRYRPQHSEAARLATMLAHHNVDLVFDIGANTGQFALALRGGGYAGRIVSFEPLRSAHAELLAASASVHAWEVAPRTAVGDASGTVELNLAANSVSSSVLPMLDRHVSAAPASGYVASEWAPLETLDRLAAHHLRDSTASFIKIDTQGYEEKVLDGAKELLGLVRGVQLEMSLVPLYGGQALFDTLHARMLSLGFSPWAIWPGFFDPADGRMLQVDATYFREPTPR
jgi:FkbM family methyltransferase